MDENLNCREVQALSQLYIDSELDLESKSKIDIHLGQCSGCQAAIVSLASIKRKVMQSSPKPCAPSQLMANFNKEAGICDLLQYSKVAGFIFILGASLFFFGSIGESNPESQIAHKTWYHTKDLPLDFNHSDPKIIKNWFGKKLGYLPGLPPKEFVKAVDFLGGRVSFFHGGVPVAQYLVKTKNGSKLSLFVTPNSQKEVAEPLILPVEKKKNPELKKANGLKFVKWHKEGQDFTVVSDAPVKKIYHMIKYEPNSGQ